MGYLKQLYRDEQGVTALEYALVAALVVIAILGALTLVSDEARALYDDVAEKVVQAITGS